MSDSNSLRREVKCSLLSKFVTNLYIVITFTRILSLPHYTLCATAILVQDLPPELVRKLPRYPLIPATLLGRLAVDSRYQGQGLGTFLLLDALRRSLMSEIASYAVVVDAIDAKASVFYQHHQFIPFPNQPQRLYLPMATLSSMFEG